MPRSEGVRNWPFVSSGSVAESPASRPVWRSSLHALSTLMRGPEFGGAVGEAAVVGGRDVRSRLGDADVVEVTVGQGRSIVARHAAGAADE